MTSGEARTWHHGLVARWWALFNLDGPRSIASGASSSRDSGRLLVPYSPGLDVDGCDVSPHARALPRAR